MTSRRAFLTTFGMVLSASKLLPNEAPLVRDAGSLAARGAMSWKAAGTHPFTGPFGLQLYSLRKQLAKDVSGTLAMVRKIGYTEVETAGLYGLSPAQFRSKLDQAGLKCTSMHALNDGLLRNHYEDVVAEAKTMGVEYVVCSWIGEEQRKTRDGYRRVAGEFNSWARALRSAGFRFAYHNHDYEFRPVEGRPALDILLADTDPNLVDFEMDVFWVKRGGQDPVAYLQNYPYRFRLMHLKGMRPGTPVGDFSVGTSEEASGPLGKGILDFPAILREAARVGVRRYYVEDESTEAPEGIKTSFQYLKDVRF